MFDLLRNRFYYEVDLNRAHNPASGLQIESRIPESQNLDSDLGVWGSGNLDPDI